MSRLADLRRFYSLMDQLRDRLGPLTLDRCSGRMRWPHRGVYFFFEEGEHRRETGAGLRVVRVGTHALKAGSRTTLWQRLSQHAGTRVSGMGNHRGSIFRLLVGQALMVREGHEESKSWGIGSDPRQAAILIGQDPAEVLANERAQEMAVSRYIGTLPFLVLQIDDDPSPASLRAIIERNSIALLSNCQREVLDPASSAWLGAHSGRDRVKASGLWNNNHVEETHDSAYLELLESAVKSTIAL